MRENNPLVSIIVITYNSAKFVLETLESAKAQSYQNIELIVSDDCSSDNTVEICREWIEENKDRFVRTELITVSENTGIPANCNRGVRAAQGEWVKLIAGDDALMENAITDVIQFVQNKNIYLLQTSAEVYNESLDFDYKKGIWQPSDDNRFFSADALTQFKLLKFWFNLNAPAMFINRKVILDIPFDEEFKKIEDFPYWLAVTRKGFKISCKNIKTVKYRIHNHSVQSLGDNAFWTQEQLETIIKIFSKYYSDYKGSYPYYKHHLYLSMVKNGFNKNYGVYKILLLSIIKLNLLFSTYYIKKTTKGK